MPQRSAPVSVQSAGRAVSGLTNPPADYKSAIVDLRTGQSVTQQRDQNSLKPRYKRLQYEGLEESQTLLSFMPIALSDVPVNAKIYSDSDRYCRTSTETQYQKKTEWTKQTFILV